MRQDQWLDQRGVLQKKSSPAVILFAVHLPFEICRWIFYLFFPSVFLSVQDIYNLKLQKTFFAPVNIFPPGTSVF